MAPSLSVALSGIFGTPDRQIEGEVVGLIRGCKGRLAIALTDIVDGPRSIRRAPFKPQCGCQRLQNPMNGPGAAARSAELVSSCPRVDQVFTKASASPWIGESSGGGSYARLGTAAAREASSLATVWQLIPRRRASTALGSPFPAVQPVDAGPIVRSAKPLPPSS